MKKTIILSFILGVLFTSCSLNETPLNGPSTGTFPSTEEEVRAGLFSAYKSLANNVQSRTPFPFRLLDEYTDIGAARASKNPKVVVKTSEESIFETQYSRMYRTAGRVHLVLDNLDNLLENGSLDEQTYNQYKSELLLIRAYVYDLGCQLWGDIPFIDHCLSLTDYLYPRTPREEVTRRILEDDLKDEMLNSLPVRWNYAEWGTGRLGRVGAYMLKARIALNWGLYEEAARCAKIALSLGDGEYSLTPLDLTFYATAEDGEPSNAPLFGFEAEKNSKEWIWALQYNILVNTHEAMYAHAPRTLNGAAGQGPTQGFIDTFQCLDGKQISESPMYDWKNPWRNRDPRLDLYTVRPDSRTMGVESNWAVTKTTVMDYILGVPINNNDAVGNKSEYGINGTTGCGGYLWRKGYDVSYRGRISNDFQDDLDIPILRFAELLLIDAEANIEMEGGDLARAADDINRIRRRVGMPDVTVSDRDGLRKALRYERTVEMCFEGLRWFDLRRWQKADAARNGSSDILLRALKGPEYAPAFSTKDKPMVFSNAIPTFDDSYIVTYDGKTFDGQPINMRVHITKNFQPGRDELWAIPQTEINTNDLMTQNPGY